MHEKPGDFYEYVCHLMFNQMPAKKGIEKHGQVAVDAMLKEFAQLDDMSVFEGIDASTLTAAQKKEALRAINLIKEKRCGTVKGRTVADGRAQRGKYDKHDISSPTVTNEGLMMSLIIDAMEEREVATADVPGAYLHAEMDDFTVLKLTGEMVDIFCQMNKKYEQYVTMEGGKKVLYLKLLKALYGCIRSAMLWYNLFTGVLVKDGFKLNPYDPCIANKQVDGKQLTVAWYVDDLKMSHADRAVLKKLIKRIEEEFGNIKPVFGKSHDYLGMMLNFTADKTVEIHMEDHIQEAIDAFDEDVTKPVYTPAGRTLFEVDEKSPALSFDQAKMFHKIVAKLLFVSRRCRLDIILAEAFLCTRVSKSTVQDKSKLKRLLRYLNTTKKEFLTLGAKSLTEIAGYIDVSYAMHNDRKSHSGGCITLGRGTLMNRSEKQKLNTKSTTESETVGCSDLAPDSIWAKNFLKHQGYDLKVDINQDNTSAINLEKNGTASAGRRSKHIDIRYFWLKDRVERGDVNIKYCPTELMIADFFTKPLQGGLFKRLKAVIMGQVSVEEFIASMSIAPKERVGTSGKTELCGTDGQSRNKGNGTQKEKKVSWHVPVPVTYASVVVSKKLAKIKSEVVDHQKNEINSKLILLSQTNS